MFFLDSTKDIHILHGEYSAPIVILSIVIACCASYTALLMNQRIQQNSFFHKYFWMTLASIAMGLGIWSMHFVGMSAFSLPISMKFDVFQTIISVFPAVFASYLAFYFANKTSKTQWSYIIAGIIMGNGISSMHYIGMAAMKMEAKYAYKPLLFFTSIIIAIVVSYVALFIFSTAKKYMGNLVIKVLTSIIMGLAITSMHYTGMFAVVFYVDEPLQSNLHQMHDMNMSILIISVTIGISVLLLISGLTSFLGRYVDYRLHHFDSLTLFPNQRQFEQDLVNKKNTNSLAVIHIHNLERWFSGYGYTFGDKIIKSIGEIINTLKPAHATVYRIEGNRFAISATNEHEYERLKLSMERIVSVLMKPLIVDNQKVVVEMVCAIANSDDRQDFRELFSNNMAVLQHPSVRYRHEVVEYDPTIHTYNFERQIVQDIDQAIHNNELYLEYQPKLCSETLKVTGVEALIRWQHPRHGIISPGIFIPIIEKNGRIFDVTDWVIQEASRQISVWVKDSVPFYHVSINIPGPYVTKSRLLHVLHDNLVKYKIDSHYIELEITETSVIEDFEKAIFAVKRFRDMGLSVALDDFGTGLSSLSYLRRIPISTIKIDKSFLDGVPLSEKDSAVLKAIITLCFSLNLHVVIEGLESKEQFDFIQSLDKNTLIQGYYFSRPLSAEQLVDWMRQKNFV